MNKLEEAMGNLNNIQGILMRLSMRLETPQNNIQKTSY